MSQLAPVIVVEARKEGGWRVAVRARFVAEHAPKPTLGVYFWQRVAGTVGNVTTFLESAANFRDKMLRQRAIELREIMGFVPSNNYAAKNYATVPKESTK